MIKAKELTFVRTENPPQNLHCNLCGRLAVPGDLSWRIADIPIHEGRDQVSIVVCSKSCQRQLMHHAGANEYMNDLVQRCEQLTPPPLNQVDVDVFADIVGEALKNLGLKTVRVSRPGS